jgi:hypothetical protein
VDPLSGASWDLFSECLGKHILSLFAVNSLSGASLDPPSECLGKHLL